MRKYFTENRQKLQILSILMFFVLVTGIVTGSIFYVKTGDGRLAINEHLKDIFSTAAQSQNKREAAEFFMIQSAVSCCIVFVCAYFKLGALLSCAVVFRKGFVTGFSAAAAAGAYGAKGAGVMGATVFDLVPCVIILVIFAAVSVSYSIEREKNSKKFLIFFAIFSISTFCIISLARGFLSTTFMKLIYPNFT